MRVVLVVPTFPQLSESFITTKAIGLLERGVDVQIVCSSSPRTGWASFPADHPIHHLRPRVHTTRSDRTWPLATQAHHLAAAFGVNGATRRRYLGARSTPPLRRIRDLLVDSHVHRLDPDVVHFEFGSLAVGRTGLRGTAGPALTVSFRGFDLAYVGLDEPDHYREVWANADGIHVLGDGLWRRAIDRGAPPERSHTVIPPALDASDITVAPARPGRLGTTDDPLRVLAVGRLHWIKGYDFLLDAIAKVRATGRTIELRVVGDGPLWEAVHHWRHHHGLDDVVSFLGALPHAEVGEHYTWADLVVHAATFEGFCNAVLEAQAHGVPVVASDAYGLRDNVVHGVTGVLVPSRSPTAMADAITELADDPDRRASMGAAGASRARTEFRLDHQLDAWVRFYEEAAARTARPDG